MGAERAALRFTVAGGVLMAYVLGDVLISAVTRSAASGHSWQALSAFSALCASFASFGAAFLCLGIARPPDGRSRKIRARRPDYSRIATLEREIYGETFSHDGAPEGGGWRVVGAASPGSIGAMRSGDVLYTLPWAIWGQAGALWLNANYPARAQPQGTASMRIERRPDGYHVWPPADNRYDLQPSAPFVGGAQGVRVAALHRPASPR